MIRGWRPALFYAAPTLLLLSIEILPLVSGQRTLYLRDVLNTHLPMKQAEAEALRAGRLPLVDVYRAGGQPLLGNPNAVPLYPDNVLYLLAPTLWALNAHFWLHWLVALAAMAWLGRGFGLSPPAAIAAGVFYALSGYFVSQLNLYNLVAVAALAPAFAGAVLRLAQGGRPRHAVAAALLWAGLLLGGEPTLAALACLLALSTLLCAPPSRRSLVLLLAALACGTLLAAPQLVELWRILPLSFRGHAGYGTERGVAASLDPRQLVEWFLPFVFGLPDRFGPGSFWGQPWHGGKPALLFTMYPGLCALALAATALRTAWNRAIGWGLAVASLGVVLAMGDHFPVGRWMLDAGGGMLRYPIKYILPLGVGGALLAGFGFERTLVQDDARARRWLLGSFAALAALYAGAWAACVLAPDATRSLLRGIVPAAFTDTFVAGERLRLAGLCLVSLIVALLALAAATLSRRWRTLGSAGLLALHAGAQLFFLRPAVAQDESSAYLRPPPLLAAIPAEARSVHGSLQHLFGPGDLREAAYPGFSARWLERRTFAELYPFTGPLWGRRYELNVAPEGLDAFLTRVARTAVERSRDETRLRLLRAWGVSRLLLDRELEPRFSALAHLVAREENFGRPLYVYEILEPAPEVVFAGRVSFAKDLLETVALLAAPDFDPRSAAVVEGEAAPALGAGGEVLSTIVDAESLEARVRADSAGVLVWQRAHLPIYVATVDGRPAPIEFANFHRMGVAVPAGEHVVRIATDRRPLRWSFAAAALGLIGVLVLGGHRRQGRRRLPVLGSRNETPQVGSPP